MNTFKRKQGNSLWVDVTCENVEAIDATWSHWSGIWSITETLGGVAILEGNLVRSDTIGTFYLRIGPTSGGATWNTLKVGTYILNTEINNTSADYRHEEQDKIIISAQGI